MAINGLLALFMTFEPHDSLIPLFLIKLYSDTKCLISISLILDIQSTGVTEVYIKSPIAIHHVLYVFLQSVCLGIASFLHGTLIDRLPHYPISLPINLDRSCLAAFLRFLTSISSFLCGLSIGVKPCTTNIRACLAARSFPLLSSFSLRQSVQAKVKRQVRHHHVPDKP